jgi:hypothetical protein
MNLIQTVVTLTAVITGVSAYLVSMYGIYAAQKEGKDDVEVEYIAIPSVLNLLVTMYLILHLIQTQKHVLVYKVIGITILIVGLLCDIYFTMLDSELRKTGAATGLMYSITTVNFIVRLFFMIQFQCSDVFARKVVDKPHFDQPRQNNPFRPPRPESIPAIGGKGRR